MLSLNIICLPSVCRLGHFLYTNQKSKQFYEIDGMQQKKALKKYQHWFIIFIIFEWIIKFILITHVLELASVSRS